VVGRFTRDDGRVRADRLVALLMLLQTRGRITAAEAAAELEVSERTARRDLDALSMAGIPVYSQQGRNGGWQLIGGARTDLSGLTAGETRALFLLAGPSLAATPELRAALRKLVRALPESFRAQAEAASRAVVVDPAGWDGPAVRERPDPPLLESVQHAVVVGERIVLDYVGRERRASRRTVHPLGLVAKGSTWYLVAGTDDGLRTFRVDRMEQVVPTGEPVERPPDFDLAATWRDVIDDVAQRRAPLVATAVARTEVIGYLRAAFGTRLAVGPPSGDGQIEIEVRGHRVESLAAELAGFASQVRVLAPAALRARLAHVGAELVSAYADDAGT
jgi:predicted DNA-binding transcriptional regulator YafY